MAKTNNLSDFLTDVANAIRIRRGYEPTITPLTTYADLNNLVLSKTGSTMYSQYSGCGSVVSEIAGKQMAFFVLDNAYYNKIIWVVFAYANGTSTTYVDLRESDFTITTNENGVYPVLTNKATDGRRIAMQGFQYSFGHWSSAVTGKCITEATTDSTVIPTSSDVRDSRMLVAPFMSEFVTIHTIAAQDFYDEIVGIPYGQENPDDYGEQVLDQSFQVHVTSGGDGEEPTEETRSVIKQFDFTGKDKIYIKWDGKNSGGPYGTCSGSVTIGTSGTTYQLYAFGTGDGGWDGLHKDQEFSVFDISALSGTQNVTFTVIADSAAGVSTTMWMEANINVKEIYLD